MRSLLFVSLLLAACATTRPFTISRTEPRGGDDVARAVAFVDALPTCAADVVKSATPLADVLAGELSRPVSARGTLAAGNATCTLLACVGRGGAPAPACCNSCGGDWILQPVDAVTKETSVTLLDGYDKPLLTYSVMDCRVKELVALPRIDVVAMGTVREATQRWHAGRAELVDAHVCRVPR
ncbi:MAG: hypothetical protein ABI321_05880 [Polyangia bacterium]